MSLSDHVALCEHVFADRETGRIVEQWVNVNAHPGAGRAMTYGRSYECVGCRRFYHLRPLVAHAPMPDPKLFNRIADLERRSREEI